MRIAKTARAGYRAAALLFGAAAAVPAFASHYENCELQGRLVADPRSDVRGDSTALSLQVQSAKERRDDGITGYVDCTDYVGRTLDITLGKSDIGRRNLRTGDELRLRRRLIDSSEGVTNEIVDLLRWKPASR